VDPYFTCVDTYFTCFNPYFTCVDTYFTCLNPYFTCVDPYFTRVGPYFTRVDPYFTYVDPYFTLRILILVCGYLLKCLDPYFTCVDPNFTCLDSYFTSVDPYFILWIWTYTCGSILHVWIRIYHAWIRILHCGSVPSLAQLVWELSARQHGFILRSVHLGCMVESVVLSQVFSECFSFPCQRHSANAPFLSVHLSHTLYDTNNFRHPYITNCHCWHSPAVTETAGLKYCVGQNVLHQSDSVHSVTCVAEDSAKLRLILCVGAWHWIKGKGKAVP
jgi:hypothetical protein